MDRPHLEVDRLTAGYGRVPVLEGVTLDLAHGERAALLGPSGCGKSTLLRCIAGFTRLRAGSIRIDGGLVADPRTSVAPSRRRVAMVFQSYALWPHLTAREHVRFVARDRARADEWLERARIAALADRLPGQLSGGEQARLALARAFASGATLLLLDEPLRNLDPPLAAGLRVEHRALAHGDEDDGTDRHARAARRDRARDDGARPGAGGRAGAHPRVGTRGGAARRAPRPSGGARPRRRSGTGGAPRMRPVRAIAAVAVLAAFGVGLVLLERGGGPGAVANGATIDLETSESCRGCHADVWAEWESSWHAQSFTDALVVSKEQSNNFRKEECIPCHAPAPVFEHGIGKLERVVERVTTREYGVDCLSCHRAEDHVIGPAMLAATSADAACRPLGRADLASPALCAPCHNQHNTVDQWEASSFATAGVTCLDCHMQPIERRNSDGTARTGRSHKFPGAHDEHARQGVHAAPRDEGRAGQREGPDRLGDQLRRRPQLPG